MKERLSRETIALRAAREFQDGDLVNLGVGIPDMCTVFVPEGRTVYLHSENGVIGFGPILGEEEWEQADADFMQAGGYFFRPLPGMCIVDHAMSFDIVRGGHLDKTVLGALEVSEQGDLANWSTGSTSDAGIGGGMDMPVGAKTVIVTMEHTTRDGGPRIVKECRYPLTGQRCVDLIVTDLAVIEVTAEGLLLKEIAPGWTVAEVQALTEPELIVAAELKEITL